MRCFVGIPLEESTRAALADAGAAIRRADPLWRDDKWVAEDNLHITVAFLGDVAPDDVPEVSRRIAGELEGVSAFTVPFGSLDAVPTARRSTMLWATFSDPDGRAAEVAARVGRACIESGIPLETRPFRAHVTLVRARRQHRTGEETLAVMESLSSTVPSFMSVPRITLFSSTLSKAGPTYEPLSTWDFPA